MNAATLSANASSNDSNTKNSKLRNGIVTGMLVLIGVTMIIAVVLAVYFTKPKSK